MSAATDQDISEVDDICTATVPINIPNGCRMQRRRRLPSLMLVTAACALVAGCTAERDTTSRRMSSTIALIVDKRDQRVTQILAATPAADAESSDTPATSQP
ncbi:MAG: hypothetical protein EBY56_09375 [Actinobacteria bacterium]|nr:hypothetical protein [Actinomycetota bacterium]